MSMPRCPGSGYLLAAIIAIIACSNPREAQAQSAQVQWSGIEQVVAFADVHGAYSELLALLRETGVVDQQDRWAAGHAHVVSLGDLLDRGADSRKVMDLLMRLQGEAQAAGGYLHVVLGNHEAMNLLGDLRYVEAAEYAAYADLEPTTARSGGNFPPGYFGHRAALSPRGKYGQWLLAQPVAIRINDTLFMHAGPGPAVRGMSLQELNLRYHTALTDYLGLAARLEQATLLQAGDDYLARPQLARNRLAAVQGGTPDAALTDTVRRFEAAAANTLLAEGGPNWYRGPALCNEAAETDVLLPLLQQFGAARLVVGHTPTRDSRAVTRFDGRVVKLDAGMNRAAYKGRAVALFIRPSGLTVRYAGETGAVPLRPEGLFVAPSELDDASVLAALRDGELTVSGPRRPNELNIVVSHGGKRFPAVFQVRDASAARKEVAAWRLDRLLGLGFVPVTVERDLQGQHGVLQARPLKWVTQAEASQRGLAGGGWCEVEPQFQLMYAFDTLVGNESRTPESILFDSDAWFVYGTSYERAFGTTTGLPVYLKARPPAPGAEIRRRLALLDATRLRAALGDLVDERGRRAILARRNALLALPAAAATTKSP
jgi:hypothetical protein